MYLLVKNETSDILSSYCGTFAGHLFAAHIHQMTLPNISTNSPSSSSSSPHHHSSAAYEEATRTAHLTHSQLLKYYIQRRRQMPNPDIELPKNGAYFFYNKKLYA
jgi:hypothetical protein